MLGVLQVDVDNIVERHLITPMREAVKSLNVMVQEWHTAGAVPEVDWSRIRSLDFQEVLKSRNESAGRLQNYACTLCSDFDHHVRSYSLPTFTLLIAPIVYDHAWRESNEVNYS